MTSNTTKKCDNFKNHRQFVIIDKSPIHCSIPQPFNRRPHAQTIVVIITRAERSRRNRAYGHAINLDIV